MKTKYVLICLLSLLVQIVASDEITTLKGKIYENAKVTRTEPDGITIQHPGGITKIFYTELPPETQDKYGYDPEKHRQYYDSMLKLKKQRDVTIQQNQQVQKRTAELKKRIASGNVTLPEWDVILKGKTSTEVLSLIGRPTSNNEVAVTTQVWRFRGLVIDRVTGERKSLVVWIRDNLVESVSAEFML